MSCGSSFSVHSKNFLEKHQDFNPVCAALQGAPFPQIETKDRLGSKIYVTLTGTTAAYPNTVGGHCLRS